MEGNANIGLMFVAWWYKEAYHRLFAFLLHLLAYIYDLFSVRLCIKTLFSPWKRDQISYENLSLQQQFQVWTLNLTSRFIGAFIKLFTLLTFVLVFALMVVFFIIVIIVWLIYPVFLAALVFTGLKYMAGV